MVNWCLLDDKFFLYFDKCIKTDGVCVILIVCCSQEYDLSPEVALDNCPDSDVICQRFKFGRP